MGSPARPAGVLSVLLASLASAGSLAGQQAPLRTLGAPTARLEEPFSVVKGVRELSDGRLIVVDTKDMTITLADFRSGETRGLSRNGSGPGEYTLPIDIFTLAADTTFVLDMMGRGRGVMIVGDSVVPDVPKHPGWSPEDPAIGFNGDQVDERGFVYSYVRPRARGTTGISSDRQPIERLDRRDGTRATIADFDSRLRSPIWRPPPAQPAPAPGSPPRPMRPITVPPFATRQQWAVAADGRIAIVDPDPYQVTYIAPNGNRTAGPVIPFEPVRVTSAEREMHRVENTRPTPTIFSDGRGGTRAGSSTPRYEAPAEWPEVLPAFLHDAVTFAGDGSLWIHRATAAGTPATYDVIDRAGRVAQRVQLPARARLVGFGNGTLYIVRLDDDDLQYLERHPLPR